ncbi:MmgE/PrpD family protein [Caballeronia sp. LZ035]|uniref:MmgE/PrpD family protein n=1 Tax=Caballeronia sp. LZ035 TaxID=3038568 RepID=UPI002864C242|nr:MmgE/PrpD family protein [Caballeronia sp. LZ035]MDR5760557.1 MmgE/PrpD family protein [Caballeronia sp. LZ035]
MQDVNVQFDAVSTEDLGEIFARFACELEFASLSAEVVAHAKNNVFDTLVCAVAGSTARGIADLRALAVEWAGTSQASTFVFGDRIPAHHAAWVNGAMAHARDYDDTHDGAVLHAGVSVVPAALAAAELVADVSGKEFLTAVVAGLETICRLGVATTIGIVESGYMYTSLFGYFAATIAAGRVMGLTRVEMINALGIVYSQVAGNHQVTRDGALTKRMQPGFAAKAAVVSVQMAKRGIRGTHATFDGLDGFLRVYLRDRFDRDVACDALGQRFEMSRLSYKPYPCCRFNHTPIEAALTLRASSGLDWRQIRRIRVGVTRQAFEAVCTPIDVRRRPVTLVHAQFSIPYTVAAAWVDGRVGLGHFTDEAIVRDDILSLANKVEPYVDEAIEREWSRNISPAALEVESMDGLKLSERVNVPLGHPDRPMTDAVIAAKATDCFAASALQSGEQAAQDLRNAVHQLDHASDVRNLVRAIVMDD